MAIWVRRVEEPTEWHWCPNCSKYPSKRKETLVIVRKKPILSPFRLCFECLRLERAENCRAQ